jgi:predicted acetyltransferase
MPIFIQNFGEESFAEISEQANIDFTFVKEKTIQDENKLLIELLEKDVNITDMNLKISCSVELDRANILRLYKANQLVESLIKKAKIRFTEQIG